MNYIIETNDIMRYNTCGDYYAINKYITKIDIKRQLNEDYEFLIMIHELIEEHLTRKRGIKEEEIMKFDMEWENRIDKVDEPGNQDDCIYKKEHRFAENIERLICQELKIDWFEYEKNLII